MRAGPASAPPSGHSPDHARTAHGIEAQPDAHYFDVMATVAETHWWYRARRAWVAQELGPRLRPGDTVLDVGTGTAETLDTLQRLCQTLRSQRRVCGSLSLTIRYSDQREVTKRERLTSETCWECDLSPVVRSLFQKCMRRRIRLRAMTLSMAGLTGFAQQGVLFDARPVEEQRRQERAKKLSVALDQLHARFGEQAIRYGRSD